VGSLIFTAGQLGLVPQTRQLAGPDIESQTRQALENLRAILEAAGSCLRRVVKTTVFLVDLSEWPRMNAVYAEFFPEMPPARSAVGVAALPMGARVEIEAVAEVCDCLIPRGLRVPVRDPWAVSRALHRAPHPGWGQSAVGRSGSFLFVLPDGSREPHRR
jgi:2-iminobutanoate/2-iminopropanoate deaminase